MFRCRRCHERLRVITHEPAGPFPAHQSFECTGCGYLFGQCDHCGKPTEAGDRDYCNVCKLAGHDTGWDDIAHPLPVTSCAGCGITEATSDEPIVWEAIDEFNVFDQDHPHEADVCSPECAERWRQLTLAVDLDDLDRIPQRRRAHR